MPILILAAMVVFAPGLVFFLMHFGNAVIGSITPIAYATMVLASLPFVIHGAIWNWTRKTWLIVQIGALVWIVSITMLHGRLG